MNYLEVGTRETMAGRLKYAADSRRDEGSGMKKYTSGQHNRIPVIHENKNKTRRENRYPPGHRAWSGTLRSQL